MPTAPTAWPPPMRATPSWAPAPSPAGPTWPAACRWGWWAAAPRCRTPPTPPCLSRSWSWRSLHQPWASLVGAQPAAALGGSKPCLPGCLAAGVPAGLRGGLIATLLPAPRSRVACRRAGHSQRGRLPCRSRQPACHRHGCCRHPALPPHRHLLSSHLAIGMQASLSASSWLAMQTLRRKPEQHLGSAPGGSRR